MISNAARACRSSIDQRRAVRAQRWFSVGRLSRTESRLKEAQLLASCFPRASPISRRERPVRAPNRNLLIVLEYLERAKGFEPSTPTLARLCSTPELHPHPRRVRQLSAEAAATGKLCQRAPGFATIGARA